MLGLERFSKTTLNYIELDDVLRAWGAELEKVIADPANCRAYDEATEVMSDQYVALELPSGEITETAAVRYQAMRNVAAATHQDKCPDFKRHVRGFME